MTRTAKSTALTLSPSHLQAIGRVAAEWSALEFAFQCAMVVASQVPFHKVVAFTAPTPMNGWIDFLSNLLLQQSSSLQRELTELFERISKAQTKRNSIVHAVWSEQFPQDIGRRALRGTDNAFGTGFPKRGRKLLVHQSYTAREIREVAKEISTLAYEFRSVFWPSK